MEAEGRCLRGESPMGSQKRWEHVWPQCKSREVLPTETGGVLGQNSPVFPTLRPPARANMAPCACGLLLLLRSELRLHLGLSGSRFPQWLVEAGVLGGGACTVNLQGEVSPGQIGTPVLHTRNVRLREGIDYFVISLSCQIHVADVKHSFIEFAKDIASYGRERRSQCSFVSVTGFSTTPPWCGAFYTRVSGN